MADALRNVRIFTTTVTAPVHMGNTKTNTLDQASRTPC
jgi:hypothetical protein